MKNGEALGQTPADLGRELLGFGQAPGKYSLRLGEPKLLFSRLDTVAQWAAGRLPAEFTTQAPQLTAAAVLFIQRACFAPGNTHYQILGLTASTLTPELLRTRYRSLIRLTHPDMGIAGLPPDAAGMVNRALDVLSDDFARQRYDDQLKKSEAPRPPPTGNPAQAAGPGPSPHMGAGPGWKPSGYAHPRRRVTVAPVPPKQGFSERLLGLLSQYPRQVHWALVAGIILVPVGLVLFWAAQDTTKGGVLVASKRPPPVSSSTQGKPPEAARVPLLSAKPQEKPQAAEQQAAKPPASNPQQVQGSQPTATAAATHTPAPTNKAQSNASPANSPTIHIASAAPTQQPSLQSAPSERTESPARTEPPKVADWVTQLSASQPPAHIPTPAPERASTQAFAASVPAGPAPYLKQVVAAAPPPATASAATRTLAPAAQPAVAPAPPPVASLPPPPPASVPVSLPATAVLPANSVDVTEAKRYLADIVGTLESAPRARHLQDYLSGMKVRGTLLRPALEFIGRHPGLSVHRSAWAEQRQSGLLSLRSTIVLRPASAGNEARLYNLHAEFEGTEQGTVLVRLELMP